jgi:hypothetical protein
MVLEAIKSNVLKTGCLHDTFTDEGITESIGQVVFVLNLKLEGLLSCLVTAALLPVCYRKTYSQGRIPVRSSPY